MPPAKATKVVARKRVRKRKRRAASSSSSSLSSDSSSSEDESPPKITLKTISKSAKELSSSSSESEESDSSSSAESSIAPSIPKPATEPTAPKPPRSPSPSPPPAEIPSFLPEKTDPLAEKKETELKDNFRKFWMSSIAEGFSDDLEELRKEPNLGTERLALLIDSLASGADVFSSKVDDDTTEMDVIMG